MNSVYTKNTWTRMIVNEPEFAIGITGVALDRTPKKQPPDTPEQTPPLWVSFAILLPQGVVALFSGVFVLFCVSEKNSLDSRNPHATVTARPHGVVGGTINTTSCDSMQKDLLSPTRVFEPFPGGKWPSFSLLIPSLKLARSLYGSILP